ncbi:hypothetical protein OIO90_003742 [Microbotryomycetes sp. JL221]|nr:hypothetical protein OIO90_003742 [Microbotryomycetes sp. JL221]
MKAPIDEPTTLRQEIKDGVRVHVCTVPNCAASFRKLEHATRHSRTHTQIRPYTCNICSKAFARQDTLNRHCRLHFRKDGEGPAGGKPRRKRKSSVSPAAKTIELHPAPTATVKRNAPAPSSPMKPVAMGLPSASTKTSDLSSTALGLSASLPVAPPSFPAYSKPFSVDDLLPIDAFMPMPQPIRRHSDNLATTMMLGQAPSTFGRPRANTLAGLPEALGSFSLVASPESSTFLSDSDSDSDDKYTTPEDVKSDSVSQYPSPAFTTHSPSSLEPASLSELNMILANDPVPAGDTALFTTTDTKPDIRGEVDEGFDFESFAAGVEGASPPTTLNDFFAARPPTPPASAQSRGLNLPEPQEPGQFAPKTAIDNFFGFDFGGTTAPQASNATHVNQHNLLMKPLSPPGTAPLFDFLQQPAASPPTTSSSSSLPPFLLGSSGSVSNMSNGNSSMQTAGPDLASLLLNGGNSFASVMAMSQNGLGLSNLVPNQALLDVYRRKQMMGAGMASMSTTAATTTSSPAFYIPSSCGEDHLATIPEARSSLPVPAWNREAKDGADMREVGALFAV